MLLCYKYILQVVGTQLLPISDGVNLDELDVSGNSPSDGYLVIGLSSVSDMGSLHQNAVTSNEVPSHSPATTWAATHSLKVETVDVDLQLTINRVEVRAHEFLQLISTYRNHVCTNINHGAHNRVTHVHIFTYLYKWVWSR